jgi:hypothetical protein
MTSVSEQPPRALWRRLLRPMLGVAGLVVVLVWVLPQFIDYDAVWSALKQLDAWELAALVLLALARVPTEAIMYRAFLPGLGLTRGSEAYLSSNLAGQLLPPPSASLIQYGYFCSGGYEPDSAEIAAFGSFVFPTLGRFYSRSSRCSCCSSPATPTGRPCSQACSRSRSPARRASSAGSSSGASRPLVGSAPSSSGRCPGSS